MCIFLILVKINFWELLKVTAQPKRLDVTSQSVQDSYFMSHSFITLFLEVVKWIHIDVFNKWKLPSVILILQSYSYILSLNLPLPLYLSFNKSFCLTLMCLCIVWKPGRALNFPPPSLPARLVTKHPNYIILWDSCLMQLFQALEPFLFISFLQLHFLSAGIRNVILLYSHWLK